MKESENAMESLFNKFQPFPFDVRTLCLYTQFLSRNYLSAVKTLHSVLDIEISSF